MLGIYTTIIICSSFVIVKSASDGSTYTSLRPIAEELESSDPFKSLFKASKKLSLDESFQKLSLPEQKKLQSLCDEEISIDSTIWSSILSGHGSSYTENKIWDELVVHVYRERFGDCETEHEVYPAPIPESKNWYFCKVHKGVTQGHGISSSPYCHCVEGKWWNGLICETCPRALINSEVSKEESSGGLDFFLQGGLDFFSKDKDNHNIIRFIAANLVIRGGNIDYNWKRANQSEFKICQPRMYPEDIGFFYSKLTFTSIPTLMEPPSRVVLAEDTQNVVALGDIHGDFHVFLRLLESSNLAHSSPCSEESQRESCTPEKGCCVAAAVTNRDYYLAMYRSFIDSPAHEGDTRLKAKRGVTPEAVIDFAAEHDEVYCVSSLFNVSLVQVGDTFDRGPYDQTVFELEECLISLEGEHKGRFHFLLGNHEEVNIFQDGTREPFGPFYEFVSSKDKTRSEDDLCVCSGPGERAARTKWLEQNMAFILQRPTVARIDVKNMLPRLRTTSIGDSLVIPVNDDDYLSVGIFTHGGIEPRFVEHLCGTETINDSCMDIINLEMYKRLTEISGNSLGGSNLPPVAEWNVGGYFPVYDNPLWVRAYITKMPDDDMIKGQYYDGYNSSQRHRCNQLADTLKQLGAGFMIVGHTVSSTRLLNGRAVLDGVVRLDCPANEYEKNSVTFMNKYKRKFGKFPKEENSSAKILVSQSNDVFLLGIDVSLSRWMLNRLAVEMSFKQFLELYKLQYLKFLSTEDPTKKDTPIVNSLINGNLETSVPKRLTWQCKDE